MSNRTLPAIAKGLMTSRARIADPKNWCQGRMRKGDRVCAMGALGEREARGEQFDRLNESAMARFHMFLVSVNDYLGHAAVMQVFDDAISKAINE